MARTTHKQQGGITILVALMLLVLLTIAALGMSKNSFREVIISGTARQGSMVRNTADAGIEWSLYWLDIGNAQSGQATGMAAQLNTLKSTLLLNDSMSGQPYLVNTQAPYTGVPSFATITPDQTLPGTANEAQGFTIALTRMGKLPITNMSQGVGPGSFSPAQGGISLQAPDLWSVRSDAQVDVVAAGTIFTHSKEAWITTPVQ